MQAIINTIALAQKLAEEKGHNLGPFKVMRLNNEVLLMYACCQNGNCLWSASFSPFCNIITETSQQHIDITTPLYVLRDCQNLTKPNKEELAILEKVGNAFEASITETHPGAKIQWSNDDIEISIERLLDWHLDDIQKYIDSIDPEQRNVRLARVQQLGHLLFEQFEIVEVPPSPTG